MEKMREALREYGLSEKEVDVYLDCLILGSSTVNKISEKCKLPRSTVYDVVNSLIKKGLVGQVIKNNKRYFETADPSKLLDILEEKRERIEKILPQLKNLQKLTIKKPKVALYEGKEGIKSIFDDIIKTKEKLLVIGNFKVFSDFYKYFSKYFIKHRIKEGIEVDIICEKSPISIDMKSRDKEELRRTRFYKKMEDHVSECYVYGNKIALVTLSENQPVGVIIENPNIAKLQRMLFKNLWKKSN
ncbi:MAG: TrmB family transcriptional regulator [Candidatus Aenigmarchaeota archaeon]|nr:TrmB family transcriptional regulator [Candidatus Aenigmarchaeota archaeon]